MFVVNGRFLDRKITGVERYAREVLLRFQTNATVIKPTGKLQGLRGHAWEQFILPSRLSRRTLWSPCNTGPVISARQAVTIHDMAVFDHPEWFSRRFVAVYKAIIPELARRARAIIAVSAFTKERMLQILKISESKIHVIANGVAADFSPRPPAEVAAMRQALRLPEGPYVLSLCSLEPRKNLPTLLAAFESIRRSNSQVSLILSGAGGKSDIFSSARRTNPSAHPGIVLTGYVPDYQLPALYSGASCFVYPSLYEGFGLPVLEALACGVPVVTSDSSSLSEIGSTVCQMVDPLSVSDIAGAIAGIVQKGQSPQGATLGRSHAAKYSWDVCATATERVLLSLN